MSDESDDMPEEAAVFTPPFRKPVVEPVAVEDEQISRHPAEAYRENDGESDARLITAEDHFDKIPNVPFSVPVTRKNRLVARHEMEGTPSPANNTDATASGNNPGGGGGGDQNAQYIQVLFNMLNCFDIVCDASGTLSWTFECSEE